ncbi:MAG: hypothetical protein AAFZ52_19460, partial [Bacteroidota bacterium]
EFERGEQLACTNGGGGLFEDIPIVEDFDPRDGDVDRSVFTRPQMAFNFPREPFSVEEPTNDEDVTITRWYSYEILGLDVRVREEGQNWQDFPGDHQGPVYDQAGYSAYYDLEGQLPENAEVEITLRARGVQLGSDDKNDVQETYDEQEYVATFQTGDAPDYIMDGSIHRSFPVANQRYFLEGENNGQGELNWYLDQDENLFRNKPDEDDDLDPNGNFNYVVRFTDVAAEESQDVPVTSADHLAQGGVTFPIPKAFLTGETIYALDLIRIYTPPPGTEEDNTVIVQETLGMDGGQPGGNDGLLDLQIQPANNLVPAIPNGGLQILADFDNNQPDNPPSPGGNLDGFKKNARKVKNRGAVSATVEKSLLPYTSFYFRTSMFTTKAEKVAGISVKKLNNVPKKLHVVDVDDLHHAVDGKGLYLPYIFLKTDEGFDKVESQYHEGNFVAMDKGQAVGNATIQFLPSFRFTGTDDWRSQTFAGDGDH